MSLLSFPVVVFFIPSLLIKIQKPDQRSHEIYVPLKVHIPSD